MDNKLLRHDLLLINEHLVTPRCCVDAGIELVDRSLGNNGNITHDNHPVMLSHSEAFYITHYSIIQYFRHKTPRYSEGGGIFVIPLVSLRCVSP